MEIFYEVKGLIDEKANRQLVFHRLKTFFGQELEKALWAGEIPSLELADPGEGSDAWGSMRVGDSQSDVTQLLTSLLTTSEHFPSAEIHLRAAECPGFVLDGKTEIIVAGKYGRYSRQFKEFCKEHEPATTPWDFLIDPRIWTALLKKNQDLSENQILTTQLARAVAFAHSPKLKGPFLGFPIEYPGLSRKKKELKIPRELAARVQATADGAKLTRQELTERAVYAGLLK